MARMNWDKVKKENQIRAQGSLRVPPEQAWMKSKRKKKKKKNKSKGQPRKAMASVPQGALRVCHQCNAMVKPSRFDRHVRETCAHRPRPMETPSSDVGVHQPGPVQGEIVARVERIRSDQRRIVAPVDRIRPVQGRIVGRSETYVTCGICAIEVLSTRLPTHQAIHKAMRPILSDQQMGREGVPVVDCRRCGERVRVDLLRHHLGWHTPYPKGPVRARTAGPKRGPTRQGPTPRKN
jgi:hypothetical protein